MISRRTILSFIATAIPATARSSEATRGTSAAHTNLVEGTQKVLVPYATNYNDNSHNAYARLFNASGLAKGVDFDANWIVDPATFPSNTTLTWFVPEGKVSGGGIWGYHHIDYNTKVSKQINNFNKMRTVFNWSYTGSHFFNLLVEFWLAKTARAPAWTTDPKADNPAAYEIGLFLHCPDYRFHNGGTLIGNTHENNGINYTCRANGRYITFAPISESDILAGTFDWILARDYLISHRVISGTEWVVDYAPLFGVEPSYKMGSGSHGGDIKFNHLNSMIETS